MPAAAEAEAMERELVRLPGVEAARVVVDRAGRPVEVHVLSTTAHDPRRLVRDVQTVALSTFGIDIDRRVVSVARLADKPASRVRPSLVGVKEEVRGLKCAYTVTLELEGQQWTGTAMGSPAQSSRLRSVGMATLDALKRMAPAMPPAELDSPLIVCRDPREVAVVTVGFLLGDHEERVCGSAMVREEGAVDAVARAVLDATNRRLAVLVAASR